MSFLSQLFSTIVSPLRILMSWCARLIPGLGKLGKYLAGLSLAAMVAWLTLLFLLIVLGAGVLRYLRSDPSETAARDWRQYFLVAFCMMPVICLAVYWVVRLLSQKRVSKYPDLDEAWQIGTEALRRQNIDIRRTPLFVVHGNNSAAEARRIIKAAELRPKVEPPEHADLALSWFANESAIYLFVTKASCLSALCASDAASWTQADAQQAPAVEWAGKTIGDEMDLDSDAGPPPEASPAAADYPADNVAGSPATAAAGHTLTDDLDQELSEAAVGAPTPPPQRGASLKRIDEGELRRQQERLRYVCGLLKQVRRPFCGMNGLLSLAPFDQVNIDSAPISESLQKDLDVLQTVLAIRCPAFLLITEMQNVDGFMELVKRMATSSTPDDRIGRGCETWGKPSTQRMEAIAANAAGAFEDLVFRHFRRRIAEALQSPSNGRLVSLLSQTRGPFAKQLQQLMGSVYGCESPDQKLPLSKQFLFSGCYFAATGGEDEAAYVRGVVVAKLRERQSKLQWGEQAIREDETHQNWSNLCGVFGMLALLVLLVGAAGLWLPLGDK